MNIIWMTFNNNFKITSFIFVYLTLKKCTIKVHVFSLNTHNTHTHTFRTRARDNYVAFYLSHDTQPTLYGHLAHFWKKNRQKVRANATLICR